MNKFTTPSVIGLALSFVLFVQTANSQALISGHVYSDVNKNSAYDAGEGLSQVTVWLLSDAAVSPYYQVYPVQTANTASDGSYSFTNVGSGYFYVKVKRSTLNPSLIFNPAGTITQIISDNNPYNRDAEPDGMTLLNITSGTYANIDFGFLTNELTPGVNPNRRFAFDDSSNSFINVMSQTYNLASESCNGNTFTPTLTIATDRQNNASAETYPMAGCNSCFPNMYWPGQNKGGFHGDDVTLQLFFGQSSSGLVNNDKETLTFTFNSLMSDVHFTIYDIDAINPQLINGSIDHVRVIGYDGNSPVMPVIIAPQNQPYLSIYGNNVSGWPDYPDNNSTNNYPDSYNSGDEDHGNAEVYFSSLVDRIVVEYEEYAPLLLPSAKKISVPVSPIDDESQWALPADPTIRGISIGSIGYTYFCSLLAADQMNFEAKAAGQKVNLQWSRATEQDLASYRAEHLSANGTWTPLATIKAVGDGHVYHFTDLHPLKGTNQYRLALLGNNGSYHLSEIRKVNIGAGDDIQLINNPASSLSLMLYGDAKNVSVYDGTGKLIVDYAVKQNSNGGTLINLNNFALNTGFYFVTATFANGGVKTLKFVKN